ncbi:MAG: PAS domain-containing protein, partial [Deltaproteobacteria bacterium]|nr:PAS domain-containing protein [Deltaproteobacteria bacterium]
RSVTLEDGAFRLHGVTGRYPRLPIDRFMTSLAEAEGVDKVAIILSGTGTDGSQGVLAIKARGGRVLIQDPASAGFDGMPNAAIESGAGDLVGRPRELAAAITDPPPPPQHHEEPPAAYSQLVTTLRDHTGVDLVQYKQGTMLRRLDACMQRSSQTIEQLTHRLESDNRFANVLLSDLTVTVTDFFRDPLSFESFTEHALVPTLSQRATNEPLRIWTAGCATGQEAYTLAMLAEEAIDRLGQRFPIKVFATDIDTRSLEFAAAGTFTETQLQRVSEDRRERFFVQQDNDRFTAIEPLRRNIVFARHDILVDPPFSHVDIVSCRNLLIYLEPEAQRRVYAVLHFAAKPGGYVMLGSSETPPSTGAFESVDRANRLFRIRGKRPASEVVVQSAPPRATASTPTESLEQPRLPRAIVNAFVPGTWIAVDDDNVIRYTNGDLRPFLDLPGGTPRPTLDGMVRAELASLAQTAIRRASSTGRQVHARGELEGEELVVVARALTPHAPGWLLHINPPHGPDVGADHVVIEPSPVDQIQPLHEEIAELRRQLREVTEEREATHEELQATNEELMSSNEELQSSNEELQSVNEELHTVNAELQSKLQLLTTTTDDLKNLLRNVSVGVIYLDAGMRIREFNPAAVEFVPIDDHDLGRVITDLAPRLAIDFHSLTSRALGEQRASHIESTDQSGQVVLVTASPYRTADLMTDGVVLTFTDVTAGRVATAQVEALSRALDLMGSHTAVLGPQLEIHHAGATLMRECGLTAETVKGAAAESLFTTDPPRSDGLGAVVEAAQQTGRWDGRLRLVRQGHTSRVVQATVLGVPSGGSASGFVVVANPTGRNLNGDAPVLQAFD